MSVVFGHLAEYRDGIIITIELALLSYVFAAIIGVVLASFRVSPVPPLQRAASLYVGFFRNTPLVVLFALFFFGLTKVGIQYSPFVSSIIVLSAYTGAYVGEAVRSGVNSVSKGQAEAARAIGLNFRQVLSLVILPQALRTVVAPLGNLFIANAKNTSIAFTISVIELTGTANQLTTRFAEPIPIFLAAAVGYLAIVIPAGLVFGAIESKVAIKR